MSVAPYISEPKNEPKNDPKWQKILSVLFCISGTVHHIIVIFGKHVLNDEFPGKFFHFSKF